MHCTRGVLHGIRPAFMGHMHAFQYPPPLSIIASTTFVPEHIHNEHFKWDYLQYFEALLDCQMVEMSPLDKIIRRNYPLNPLAFWPLERAHALLPKEKVPILRRAFFSLSPPADVRVSATISTDIRRMDSCPHWGPRQLLPSQPRALLHWGIGRGWQKGNVPLLHGAAGPALRSSVITWRCTQPMAVTGQSTAVGWLVGQ